MKPITAQQQTAPDVAWHEYVEDFRRSGHDAVDWIADYLETPDRYPVLPRVTPGEIRRALPASAPERGESFDAIFADFERILVPGHFMVDFKAVFTGRVKTIQAIFSLRRERPLRLRCYRPRLRRKPRGIRKP